MIRPSSTPSPPLRAGFPSRARFSSFPSRAFPARRLCPFALPTSSLWRARTHTTHARYTSLSATLCARSFPSPDAAVSQSKLLSYPPPSPSHVRAGFRGRCRPEALRLSPLSLSLSFSLSAPGTRALLSLNALSFSPSRPAQSLRTSPRSPCSTHYLLHKTSVSRAFPLFAQLRLLKRNPSSTPTL